MPKTEQSSAQASEKLLTAKERDACQKVAASGEGLIGQRATALLAIDQGATHAQAAEQVGLTVGQIRYLLRTFRQKRLAAFPDAEPGETQSPTEAAKPEKEIQEKKKAKPKRGKKAKEAKAKKKAKKPKKGKKAKAPKAEKAKKDKAAKKKSKKK